MNNDLYFVLFSSCIPVKGANESILSDLQRSSYSAIPSLLIDVLKANNGKTIGQLKSHFNNEMDEGIDAFFNHFEEKELGFFTDEPECFPPLELDWYSPKEIHAAVVEFSNDSSYDLRDVFSQLIELGCETIQLRIFGDVPLLFIQEVIHLCNTTRVINLELFIPFEKKELNTDLFNVLETNPRLTDIFVYNAPEKKSLPHERNAITNKIKWVKQSITKAQQDFVSQKHFLNSIQYFTQAQEHNIALNRKVSINYKGEIKNYVSHQTVFGNVSKDKLKEVISTSQFQEKWFIPNDKIEKCKDCQFRYMCFSNSDVKLENGKYYKTQDCGFDPYANKWNN